MSARKKASARRRAAPVSSERSNWWEERSDRAQHAICIASLVAVSLTFFAPIHFTDLTLIGGDTVEWRAMAEYMMDYREQTGEEPLWAPNAFGGMPGYFISPKTIVPQVDDVFSALRRLLWPSSHLIVLLLGTYFLVVFLTRNKLAGVLAAIGYGFTTYLPIILVAGHNSKFIALAFAPWLVLAFANALRRPGLLSGLLFAAALAANLRAGHIQPTYYISFLMGVWWIAEGIAAGRGNAWRPFLRATLWLVVGSILGLMMVAQPYLSQAESKAYTIRGAASGGVEGGLDWEYAMNWSQGVGELLTLLIAHAFGGGAAYWGPKPFTAGPHYVGGIILLLATIAVVQLRSRAVIVFAVSILLMVLFALGDNFALLNRAMFELFPLFNALRAPETWLSTAAFALAVLAAFGLWRLTRKDDDQRSAERTSRITLTTIAAFVVTLLFLLLLHGSLLTFERPAEYERTQQQLLAQQPDLSPEDPRVRGAIQQHLSQLRDQRQDMFRADAVRTLVFLLLGGALIWLFQRQRIGAPVMQAGLALLVLIDLWGVDRRYLNSERLVPEARLEARIPTYDFDRYILERQQEAGGMGRFRVISFESGNPLSNARPSYHFESLSGYTGAKLRVYQDFLDHVLFDGGLPNPNALDLLNTRYLIAPGTLPGLNPVYRDDQTGMIVLENPDALPRAFFVHEIEVESDPERTWERLKSTSFNPHQTAIVAEPLELETLAVDTARASSVELVSYSPRHIAWDVETDAHRLLVVSEVYYPAGWKATINGEETPIYRANYLLRGVVVPPGAHRVEMRFEPSSHRVGVLVSAIGTIAVYGGILGLLGVTWMRRRREEGGGDT